MHGHHEDITKVDFTLTEPSQMIGGKPEGGELWLAHLRKPRPGEGCFDLSWVLIAGSHVSAKRESRNNTYPMR
jgi:hypothetical protein